MADSNISRNDFIVDFGGEKVLIETIQKQYRSDLGALIHNARKEANMTQVTLAGRANVERSNLTRIEKGEFNPSLGTIVKIAEALGKVVKITFEDKKPDDEGQE